MTRLVLLRHARTASVRAAAFPGAGDGLDVTGRADARAGAAVLDRRGFARDGVLASPGLAARETAALLAGGRRIEVDPAIRDADPGAWADRPLVDVAATEPGAWAAWRTDPTVAPPGGESLAAVLVRVRGWLAHAATRPGRRLVVTHAAVVRAAVVHVLDAPVSAFWRIDVAPLHAAALVAHDGRWTLRAVNVPLAEARA